MKTKLTLTLLTALFFSISAYAAPGGKPNKDELAADIATNAADIADLLALIVEFHSKTVFVTEATFDGDLGGLAGADLKCQAATHAPGSIVPAGEYKAWLSDTSDSPDTRFNKSSFPYVLPDGTPIATDYADLTDGTIINIIDQTQTGGTYSTNTAWTGTNSDGTLAIDEHCVSWTSNEWEGPTLGAVGKIGLTDPDWSNQFSKLCDGDNHLYCFQQ